MCYYYLSIPGVGRSFAFEIASDVYTKALRGQAQGVYEQRCGCELDPKLTGGWKRIACHATGLKTTTVQHHLHPQFGPLAENVEQDPNPAYPAVKAAHEKVENDPSLEKGVVFKPLGATQRVDDPAQGVTWMTGEGDENGLVADYAIDPAKGATISWWARRIDSFGGNEWHGPFYMIGESKALANHAIWGSMSGIGRISDKKWWHMVLRIGTPDEKGVAPVQFIVNGRVTDQHRHGVKLADLKPTIAFGEVHGKAAEGVYYRDIRVYSRALSDQELADLTASVPETLDHVIEGHGGHHDAGDYNPRAHIDVAEALMNAYELKPGNFTDGQLPIPEAGNGLPDIVDEALWAVKNPTEGIKSLTTYGSYNFVQRAAAAAQLYHTTGEKRYHDDFLALTPWRKVPHTEVESYGYFDLRPAAYAYMLLPREKADPQVWDAVLGSIRKQADMYIRGSEKMAYKFIAHPYAPITWGTGAYENYAVEPAFVWALTGEETYRDWLIRTCDNTLGTNPMGISYITGLGQRTIRCPLHNSRYRPEGVAVDGLQGQGPNKNGAGYAYTDVTYPWFKQGFAVLYQLADVHYCIAMDEPTVNNMANTMMIFGLLAK